MRDIKLKVYNKDGKSYIKVKKSLKLKIKDLIFNIKGKLSKSPCYKCIMRSCYNWHNLEQKRCKYTVNIKNTRN